MCQKKILNRVVPAFMPVVGKALYVLRNSKGPTESARAFRRNELDRFYLTAAKIAVIDSAVENCSDSDLKTIFQRS